MPNRRKPPSDLMPPDAELWHKVRETIKPLPTVKSDLHVEPVKPLKRPVAAPGLVIPSLVETPSAALVWDDDTPYNRPDQKRMKQGLLQPTATLDLHGYTVARAEKAITQFLQQAIRDQHQWVEIITGHGRFKNEMSVGETGVLKRLLPEWLNQPAQRVLIKRILPAPKSRGGAVWIALKF